jgi:PPM family protein phosphatase
MNFEDLAGHVLPILLAIVAIVLIIQSLFEREPVENKEKSKSKGEGGGEGAGAPESSSGGDVEAAKENSVEVEQHLYDFSADLDDSDPDDPYEITLMGEVPDEIKQKIKPKLAIKEREKEPEEPVEELFLVTGVARSDRGIKRQVNEDAFLVLEDEPMFLVADGMGGYAGGDVASQLCVDVIQKAFATKNFEGPVNADWPQLGDELARTFQQAHDLVRREKEEQPKYMDMGTTAVAIRFSPDKTKAFIANIGDSRCYRLRGDELTQLTTDHTLGTLLGIKGKGGRKLTQAIGVHETIAVDLFVDEPAPGDLYIVCSDGLTKMVDDETIQRLVTETEDLEEKAKKLIDESNERGGKDNITVVVIRVDERPAA